MLAAGLISVAPADAAVRHRHHLSFLRASQPAHRIVPMPGSATDPDKDAALILDAVSGKVLYARNETAERHPASLTKMMTLYMLFEALKAGRITMQTPMPVSAHAAQQKPTKLSLRPGETITVDTAIRAIVIRSANDVAVVIAEALGGTELHFAQMMTDQARALACTKPITTTPPACPTRFRSPPPRTFRCWRGIWRMISRNISPISRCRASTIRASIIPLMTI